MHAALSSCSSPLESRRLSANDTCCSVETTLQRELKQTEAAMNATLAQTTNPTTVREHTELLSKTRSSWQRTWRRRKRKPGDMDVETLRPQRSNQPSNSGRGELHTHTRKHKENRGRATGNADQHKSRTSLPESFYGQQPPQPYCFLVPTRLPGAEPRDFLWVLWGRSSATLECRGNSSMNIEIRFSGSVSCSCVHVQ